MFRLFSSRCSLSATCGAQTAATFSSFFVPSYSSQRRDCSTLADLSAAAQQMSSAAASESKRNGDQQNNRHTQGRGSSQASSLSSSSSASFTKRDRDGKRNRDDRSGGRDDRGGGGGGRHPSGVADQRGSISNRRSDDNNTIANNNNSSGKQSQRSLSSTSANQQQQLQQRDPHRNHPAHNNNGSASSSSSSSSLSSPQTQEQRLRSTDNNETASSGAKSSSSSGMMSEESGLRSNAAFSSGVPSRATTTAAEQPAITGSGAARDVRTLELQLRQAYERLEKVLQRSRQQHQETGVESFAALSENSAAGNSGGGSAAGLVVPLHAGGNREATSAVSAQENPHVEQEFVPAPAEQQPDATTRKLGSQQPQQQVPVSFSRTEFGVARAEIVGVVAPPGVVLMRDNILERDFAKMFIRVSASSSSSSSSSSVAATTEPLSIEVRVYGEVLLRSVVNGGIPPPSTAHTVIHVTGKLAMTASSASSKDGDGKMIVTVGDDCGSISVVVIDPK